MSKKIPKINNQKQLAATAFSQSLNKIWNMFIESVRLSEYIQLYINEGLHLA